LILLDISFLHFVVVHNKDLEHDHYRSREKIGFNGKNLGLLVSHFSSAYTSIEPRIAKQSKVSPKCCTVESNVTSN
jgi:hypothetical protein